MAEQLHIDVVMTDIKMPYMDGLTSVQKSEAELPEYEGDHLFRL